MGFRIAEKYRLEIRWKKAIYEQEGLARLEKCYFTGPVLKEVNQINQEDHMNLDFSNQYIIFVPSYYIGRLSWKGANQTPEAIYLTDVLFKNKYINSVPKLNNDDYIVIDTKNHEEEKHHFHLTYPSYLIRFDGELYKFER